MHGNDDAAMELGNDAGSGFTGGRVVEYGTADREFAGRDGIGGEAGAECLGRWWADSGFRNYVDDAVDNTRARADATHLALRPQSRVNMKMSRDILPSL